MGNLESELTEASVDANGNPSPELRGETMAYAAQSFVYNAVPNVFDSYVSYRIQKHAHPGKHGSYAQNLGGEFLGDMIGSGALMLAEAMVPRQLHAVTRRLRGLVDPLYTSVAHIVFRAHKNEPDYEKKVEQWKTFQERSLVRSGIIATAGIAGNVATQKWIGNETPAKIIFAGKLASTALTTSLSLGARLAFPEQMKSVDRWISRKIFTPMMEDDEAKEGRSR